MSRCRKPEHARRSFCRALWSHDRVRSALARAIISEDLAMADDEALVPETTPAAAAEGGFGSRLFDQAKRARDQASAKAADLASRAGELKDQASARAGEIKDQAATRAGEVKEQVAARAVELKDTGFTRVTESLDD